MAERTCFSRLSMLSRAGGADKAALVRAARAQPSGEFDYYHFENAWQVVS
jgi:hypothetical protein